MSHEDTESSEPDTAASIRRIDRRRFLQATVAIGISCVVGPAGTATATSQDESPSEPVDRDPLEGLAFEYHERQWQHWPAFEAEPVTAGSAPENPISLSPR